MLRRPFWITVGQPVRPDSWPVADLDEWVRLTQLPPGFQCQVLWREVQQTRYRSGDHRTPAEAAKRVRELLAQLGHSLCDIGISPDQPLPR